MKKWIGTLLLLLLAVASIFTSITVHEWAVPFNCVPLLVWIIVVTTCQRRWPSLGNSAAVIFGIAYGALAGIGTMAFINSLLNTMWSSPYYRNPYDSAAYGIILLLSLILFISLAIVDYVKFRYNPLWVRIATAMVAFLPCMLMAMHIMAYFERVLSQYVS